MHIHFSLVLICTKLHDISSFFSSQQLPIVPFFVVKLINLFFSILIVIGAWMDPVIIISIAETFIIFWDWININSIQSDWAVIVDLNIWFGETRLPSSWWCWSWMFKRWCCTMWSGWGDAWCRHRQATFQSPEVGKSLLQHIAWRPSAWPSKRRPINNSRVFSTLLAKSVRVFQHSPTTNLCHETRKVTTREGLSREESVTRIGLLGWWPL